MATARPDPAPKIAPKLAIVARAPGALSQTFIRHHIHHLNGGNNAIISWRRYDKERFDKPIFFYDRSRLVTRTGAWSVLRNLTSRTLTPRNHGTMRTFLKEEEVSHILLEFGYIATDLGQEALASGLPVYCMFRGNDASSRLQDWTYRRTLQGMFDQLAGVIAVSSHLLDNLAAHGMKASRSIVVPSGVDTTLFQPGKPQAGKCVCVGRLVEKKSPLPLLRAFAKVADKHNLTLDFIGEGPLQARAEKLVAELGIADRISFFGRMPHDKVRERVRNAQFYIQHFHTPENGDTEGMPGSIQEAMACGLPIVTTRHAGIPDHLIDGENGRMVEPHDMEGFAAALGELASNAALRQRLGTTARAYAEANLDFRISHRRVEAFMGLKSDCANQT